MLTQDSAERKRIPMFRGLLQYFPDALAAVANHSFENNEKHNPGEPLHWAREKSTDQDDTIIRHMTDLAASYVSPEERMYARRAVAWRALAALQLEIEAQYGRRVELKGFEILVDTPVETAVELAERLAPVDSVDDAWRQLQHGLNQPDPHPMMPGAPAVDPEERAVEEMEIAHPITRSRQAEDDAIYAVHERSENAHYDAIANGPQTITYSCGRCGHDFATPKGLAAHRNGATRCVPTDDAGSPSRIDVV